MKLLNRLRRRKPVVIVSGLPRSGTSMMMKMLEAGGIEPLTDNLRTADDDNPKGYYEFERVKQLDKGDKDWLPLAEGKVVKVISALLSHLPDTHTYRIIFMRRALAEILASQKRMLVRRGEPTDLVSDEELTEMYEKHLGHVTAWIRGHDNVSVSYVNYNELLSGPRRFAVQVNEFLGGTLDVERMVEIVDPSLYRQRA